MKLENGMNKCCGSGNFHRISIDTDIQKVDFVYIKNFNMDRLLVSKFLVNIVL